MTISEFISGAERLIRMQVPMEMAEKAWKDAAGDPQIAYILLETRMLAEHSVGAPTP